MQLGRKEFVVEKGFTLIEMLLVVAIVGFLVAILLPGVAGVSEGAKEKAVRADLRLLKSAVEAYYISFGVYPTVGNWGDKDSELITADNGTNDYKRIIDQFSVDQYGTGGAVYLYDLDTSGRDTYVIYSAKGAAAPTAGDDVVENHTVDDIFVTNAADVTTP